MTDPKTIADVADHAIDRLSGGAAELAKAVKQVAPHAWEVAVRQQVASGILDLVTAAIIALGPFVAFRLLKKPMWDHVVFKDGRISDYLSSDAIIVRVVFSLGCMLAALAALVYLRSGVQLIVVPEFAAAHDIIKAVK